MLSHRLGGEKQAKDCNGQDHEQQRFKRGVLDATLGGEIHFNGAFMIVDRIADVIAEMRRTVYHMTRGAELMTVIKDMHVHIRGLDKQQRNGQIDHPYQAMSCCIMSNGIHAEDLTTAGLAMSKRKTHPALHLAGKSQERPETL